jgi:hypothetical protein
MCGNDLCALFAVSHRRCREIARTAVRGLVRIQRLSAAVFVFLGASPPEVFGPHPTDLRLDCLDLRLSTDLIPNP